MNKLKIGFIIDGNTVDPNIFSLIEEVIKDNINFSSPVLVSLENKSPKLNYLDKIANIFSKRKPIDNLLKNLLGFFVINLELKKLRKNSLYVEHGILKITDSLDIQKIDISPMVSDSGFIYRFEDKDIDRLEPYNLDVLIRCGSGILRGKILHFTRFGILSLHHGDNRVYRGIPAGFWEVFHGEPSTGFIIQKLNKILDGGEVLFRGSIMTASYWQLNYANICKKSNFFMLRLLRNIAQNNRLPESEITSSCSNKLFHFPSPYILFRYICKQGKYFLKNKILYLSKYRTTWNISYIKHEEFDPKLSDLTTKILSNAITISNPDGRFLADPFLFSNKGRTVCFAEDFFFEQNRGKISAYEITYQGYQELGVILEEDFHLSFPYIFQYKNNIYMCPETSEKKEIRLYICNEYPKSWSYYKTIMKNVSAVDTLIFPFDNYWCLLSNMCSSQMGEHNSELHLFLSDDPLSDKWKPNKNNPVIFDSKKGRNGGLFELNGDLYRVNQIHGKSHYGKAFGINKIIQLDDETYIEKTINTVDPSFYPNIKGTHHFDYHENFLIFDHWQLKRLK